MRQLSVFKTFIDVQSEFDLLIILLKSEYTYSQDIELDIQIPDHFDWKYFLRLANFHKVIPSVYQGLRKANKKNLPDDILPYLRKQFHANALKNNLHTQELIRIFVFLKSHQISVIPFKGPALTMKLYSNIHSRQFCDLDLLVRPEDFLKTFGLLVNKQGYHSPYLREAWERSLVLKVIKNFHYRFVAHEISLGLKHINSNSFIDLHKKISKYCNLSFDNFSDRLQITKCLETSISTLRVEDTLIVLCIHGSQDGWIKLQAINDVAYLLISQPHLDWSDLKLQAQRGRCTRRLLLGLALAKEYYGLNLPTDILNMVRQDRTLQILINQVISGLQKNPDQPIFWTIKLKNQIMRMRMLETPLDQIKHFLVFVWSYFFAKFRRTTFPIIAMI